MASPLPPSVPATHPAVAIIAPRQPLQVVDRPTVAPGPDEALIHVTWTASSPLCLHRADGGLLVDQTPCTIGSSFGGTVVALGESQSLHHVRVGDAVFGFVQDGAPNEAGVQTYATVPTYKVSRLPPNLTLPQAVAVPANLVTAFHTATADLGLELPWPVPEGWTPPEADRLILIWGAASSVGLYTVQVLRHWGYRNVVAVASGKHHEELRELGAKACFDYRSGDVVEQILKYADGVRGPDATGPRVPLIVDCIGSKEGTLRPLTKIAEAGSKVAVMLPVINVHAARDRAPEYEMDVSKALPGEWKAGVELRGVRTHFWAKNEFYKAHLQSEIVPALLEQGAIKPNKLRIVEGNTLLERAEKALDLLRDQVPSGERLVWRVAEDEE
ncbi:hypothetical protein VTK56DRAFT_9603 [Thermocarpiscus australiensis]